MKFPKFSRFHKILIAVFLASFLLIACGVSATNGNAQDAIVTLPHAYHIETVGSSFAVVFFTDAGGYDCTAIVSNGGGIQSQAAAPAITCHP